MCGRRLWLAGLALLAAALLACGGGEAAPAPGAGTAVAGTAATAEPTAAATPAQAAAPEPAATPTPTPPPTPTPALLTMAVCENVIALQEKAWVPTDVVPADGPCLATISEGSETELILEWAGGPADATKWQYRQRTATGTWGAWTDIPTGSASARRHRVSGLQPEVYNYFEVRAVTGNVAGAQSNRALGVTPRKYGGLPEMELGQVSEGGRSWILGGSVVVDVPADVRIMHKSGAYSGGTVVANVSEIETMSFQIFDLNTAEAAGRGIRGTGATASGLSIDVLFDQIVAFARLVDAPAPAVTFSYDRLDATGVVSTAGSYAFLKADATVITTYEDLDTDRAEQLRVHETDADGASRAAFYDEARVGDVFEWREGATCWIRYTVTEAATASDRGSRTFGIQWLTYVLWGCPDTIVTDAALRMTWGLRDLPSPGQEVPVSMERGDPLAPGTHYIPLGAGRGYPDALVIDVPVSDHQLKWVGFAASTPGGAYIGLSDESEQYLLWIAFSGEPSLHGAGEAPASVQDFFERIGASTRIHRVP